MNATKAKPAGRTKTAAPGRRLTKQTDGATAVSATAEPAEKELKAVDDAELPDLILLSHAISRDLYLKLCGRLDSGRSFG
jgi:hypothetical protein